MADETNKVGTQWAILIAGCAVTAVFSVGLDHWKTSEGVPSSLAVNSVQITNLQIEIGNMREQFDKEQKLRGDAIDQRYRTIEAKLDEQERHLENNDRRLDRAGIK